MDWLKVTGGELGRYWGGGEDERKLGLEMY